MISEEEDDAFHAAWALFGGQPLGITTANVFSNLTRIVPAGTAREARRKFDAMEIGSAVERLERASKSGKFTASLRLARTLRNQLAKHEPGWFRFLLALGSQLDENEFRLSYSRRPRSKQARPQADRTRNTMFGRVANSMSVAGAVLFRIEAGTASGLVVNIGDAITAAVDDKDVKTNEEAALVSWHLFRRFCHSWTRGADTYRLVKYLGPLPTYYGQWMALPDVGERLKRLPPAKGGRPPKET